jgi:hypothetical protein
MQSGVHAYAYWPRVEATDWCGEFIPVKVSQLLPPNRPQEAAK